MRIKRTSFTLYDGQGNVVSLYEEMSARPEGEIDGFIRRGKREIPVRVCYKRKSDEERERTRKRLKRKESDKQISIRPETKLFNEHIVLVTSLSQGISYRDILESYRFRRQVEIYFKRLKSILDFGELPKKVATSVLSWLNGKLTVALLMEKFLSKELFPLRDKINRSLWRETKLCLLLLKTNLFNLVNSEINFVSIASRLCVEKRKKSRPL
ncbi:MAG: hypothetical protein IKN96_02060 [Oscillibacter sp.]|nr:hypothetical protein [Oscillibacter sp.]